MTLTLTRSEELVKEVSSTDDVGLDSDYGYDDEECSAILDDYEHSFAEMLEGESLEDTSVRWQREHGSVYWADRVTGGSHVVGDDIG